MRIPVTLQLVADVLRVPRIEFPNYPSCERLRTVSRDKLMSSFCEHPTAWGKRLFTPCRPFAKGPRFMNMVMTFVLHHLSHYNFITKSRARFLLSLDFPSHFILSIIDVYRDTTSCDKLIYPFAIMRILRHFSIPFPAFNHFHVMCAIDAAIVKRSKEQFRSRWSGTAAPLIPSVPSISAPSTLVGGVTLDAIMS